RNLWSKNHFFSLFLKFSSKTVEKPVEKVENCRFYPPVLWKTASQIPKISQSLSTFLQLASTWGITALGSWPSSNSTLILRVMKLTVAFLTPGVFWAAASILLAQLAQSTSIL